MFTTAHVFPLAISLQLFVTSLLFFRFNCQDAITRCLLTMSSTSSSQIALLLNSLAYLSSNLQLSPGNVYVQVDTVQGRLRGARAVSRTGRVYVEFLGIPYAQPPLGSLRFEPPLELLPDSWNGVRHATNYGHSCLQYEYFTHLRLGHENCLNLNVYAPAQVTSMPSAGPTMPVIVFLHGGGFMSGITYAYRPKYFMDQDVVLVTLNYRVNSLGFLNTGDGVIRGNMGLKDQTMALRWVQQNIARFGGDPSRVTLMGQSAGAASVQYHLLSPMSTGLFHRAIAQSGSAMGHWAHKGREEAVRQTHRLASYLGCPIPSSGQNSVDMVACMKKSQPYDLLRFHEEFRDPLPDLETSWSPSAEGKDDENTFINDSPSNLMQKGAIVNKVPLIIGLTNDEGNFLHLYLRTVTAQRQAEVASDPAAVIRNFLGEENPEKVQRLYDFYFNNSETFGKQVARCSGDLVFTIPIHNSIQALALHLPAVYPYYFTYAGEEGATGIQRRMLGRSRGVPRLLDIGIGAGRKWIREHTLPVSYSGSNSSVAHADDLIYLFNIPGLADEIVPGSRHYELSKDLIKLWVSFARDGKPGRFEGIDWPPVSRGGGRNGTYEYLKLGQSSAMIPVPFRDRVEFWESLESI